MASNKPVDVWSRTFLQGGEVRGYRDVLDRSPMGNPSRLITKTLFGINHRGINHAVPINRDYYGLAFFTRPDMRMTDDNISKIRLFNAMLTARAETYPRAIRAYLDNRHQASGYPTPLVDPKQIFIPLLGNQLISMSGWQDVILPTYASDPGVYGEVYTHADGIASIYRTYDITANFRNIPGDPITSLFFYWVHYAAAVFEGTLTPYANNLFENAIDYQTRIWRLVLDPTKRWVQKIASTGPAFPIDVPIGARFNYEIDTPINRADQITVTFRAIGGEYIDDILIHEFNQTVILGNGDMRDDLRENTLVQIPFDMLYLYNDEGYPYIDPTTYELQWWVTDEDFEAKAAEYLANVNNPAPIRVGLDEDINYQGVPAVNTATPTS